MNSDRVGVAGLRIGGHQQEGEGGKEGVGEKSGMGPESPSQDWACPAGQALYAAASLGAGSRLRVLSSRVQETTCFCCPFTHTPKMSSQLPKGVRG